MSEPTPKRPDPTRPAVQPEKGGDGSKAYPTVPVAKRLEATGPKSSLVISKSYRVRELPPPPVVALPRQTMQRPTTGRLTTRCPTGWRRRQKNRRSRRSNSMRRRSARRAVAFRRRRVRIAATWEQWLADPQRRNKVGVGTGIALNIAIVVFAAFVLHPRRNPVAEPIQPGRGELAMGQILGNQELSVNRTNPWCGRSPRGSWRPWRSSCPRIRDSRFHI